MSNHPLGKDNSIPEDMQLMERLVERKTMRKAYSQVMRNKGAAGIDNMPVEALMSYLKEKWPEIREQLVRGESQSGGWKYPNLKEVCGNWAYLWYWTDSSNKQSTKS